MQKIYTEEHKMLCRKCFECKEKDEIIYCKEGFFSEMDENKLITLSPHDFDCPFWNES